MMAIPMASLRARVAVLPAAVLTAAALLSGCADPGRVPPRAAAFDAAHLGLRAAPALHFPQQAWWTTFGDAELDRLEAEALSANPDLQQAQARVAQARAQVELVHSAALPQVGAAFDSTRQLFSRNDIYPPPLGGGVYTHNQLLLQGAWDLDLFGRTRAQVQAAIGQQRAAAAQQQAIRLRLAADVAATYFQLGGAVAQAQVLEQTLAQRRAIAALVSERARAGLDNTLQQRQAEAEIPQIRLRLQQNAQVQQRLRDALAALLGRGPEATAGLRPALPRLAVAALPDKVPADLLGRRPDIAAARWQVQSALAGVDAARASFYPDISLSAFVGYTSLGFSQLLSAGSQAWGVGPALSLPIFEGGALRANLHARSAAADAAIDQYNATLVAAVREAADAIGERRSVQQQLDSQEQALQLAQQAHALARQRFDAGLGNALLVLAAQAPVLQLRELGAGLKAQSLIDQVALISALGGGFEPESPPGPVAAR